MAAAMVVACLAVTAPHLAHAQTSDQRFIVLSPQESADATQNPQASGQQESSTTSTNPTPQASSVAPSQPFQAGKLSSSGDDSETSSNAPPPVKSPPPPPGEFENYVRRVTGQDIKRFGTDLLLPSDRDYAVPATATVPPDYPINVGDTISVHTAGSIQGDATYTVNRDGTIFLPDIGEVTLGGVLYRDLHDRIAAAIGRKYRDFDVSVSIRKLRGVRVYVTGFANHPGAYTVNSLSTLVNAVLAAGGPSAGGSFRTIILYRNGHEVRNFDLYQLIRQGNRANDAVLQNEDVLFIPPAGPQVAVVGSVKDQAIYEAHIGESLEDALALSGGPDQLADPSRVILYRLSDKDTVGSREIERSQLATTPLQAGDIIQVLSQGSLIRPLERQSVVVRLEGEVNKPGNYFVAPNTPLSTVIQMAGGLTSRAYVYGTRLLRESVRAQQLVSYRQAIDELESTLAAAPLTSDQADPAQIAAAQTLVDRLRNTEPDGRLVLDLPYGTQNLPGDLILENNDRIVIPPEIDTVGVFGAVYRPASFRMNPTEPLRVKDYIERAGGPQRAADKGRIFVVRANGDVLTKDNGALHARVQPGDVVFVPVKTHSSSLLDKIRVIGQTLFSFGLSAAAIAAID